MDAGHLVGPVVVSGHGGFRRLVYCASDATETLPASVGRIRIDAIGFTPEWCSGRGAPSGRLEYGGLATSAHGSIGGMAPPDWLADYHWAKPAIMIMAFWAAVGSNNMILYIAGLTNIPRELNEAAEIDGAQ